VSVHPCYVCVAFCWYVLGLYCGWDLFALIIIFRWRIFVFHTSSIPLFSTAFDAYMRHIAMLLFWPDCWHLIHCTWLFLLCSGWFYFYNSVLYSFDTINVFIVLRRFKIHEEQIERFFDDCWAHLIYFPLCVLGCKAFVLCLQFLLNSEGLVTWCYVGGSHTLFLIDMYDDIYYCL
jgi:hypothetical protein